ncbi:unnamed protein product [Brassica oleracea]
MVQCRLVLKWSCAYDFLLGIILCILKFTITIYFITMHQSAKNQYVAHLREEVQRLFLSTKITRRVDQSSSQIW